MDRPGVRQVPEGSGEQNKMKETGRYLWCPNDPPSYGIGEGEGEGDRTTIIYPKLSFGAQWRDGEGPP